MSLERPVREMTGLLFPNSKRVSDKSPELTGEATVAGVRYRLGAWNKQGKNGPYVTLAFRVPENEQKGKAV